MTISRFVRKRFATETAVWLVVAAGTAVVGSRIVTMLDGRAAGNGWLAVTAAVLLWEVGYLWTNRRADGTPRTLGAANAVTITRGLAFAGVAGFLLVSPAGPLAWGPAALYGVGVTLDAVDGLIARTIGSQTNLGRRLDHAFDTLGFLLAPIVGVAWGRLPAVYLLVAAARYVYRFGLWTHERRGGNTRSLPPPRIRRPLAAGQMAFLAVALAPVVPASLVALVAVPLVAATLGVFAWDFLYATERIRPTG